MSDTPVKNCGRCKYMWDQIHEEGYVCGILTYFSATELKNIRGWIDFLLTKKAQRQLVPKAIARELELHGSIDAETTGR